MTTAEVLGREEPLIAYYRRLVAVAAAHGKLASLTPFPYFRTQPTIIADGKVLSAFSWNDDVHDTRSVLEAFVEASDGAARLVHDDQDQGWHILIAATADATCFIEWNAEGPAPRREAMRWTGRRLRGRRAGPWSVCVRSMSGCWGRSGRITGAIADPRRLCRRSIVCAPPSAASSRRAAGACGAAEALSGGRVQRVCG